MTEQIHGAPNANASPGSQGALRQLNQDRIAKVLLISGPATQAELARQTGLSTATVSNIVKNMSKSGLAKVSPTTSSGRRAQLVQLSDSDAVSVGIDFGRRHVRVVVMNVGHEIVGEEEHELPLGYAAETGLDEATAIYSKLLVAHDIKLDAVRGIGVGIPGPIERGTGLVVAGAVLPEWVGVNRLDLEQRFGLPTFIANDADLGALAEVTSGEHRGVTEMMFVKVGSGIGAGLILNGQPYFGNIGITGEIGHVPVSDVGLMCRCGNRGCLETIASTSAMIELLGRGRTAPMSTSDIVRQGLEGDIATLRVIEDVGHAIGRAIAHVTNIINPGVITIGGPLAELGDLLLGPMRWALMRNTYPLIGETTILAMSALGDRASALGAATLVFHEVPTY